MAVLAIALGVDILPEDNWPPSNAVVAVVTSLVSPSVSSRSGPTIQPTTTGCVLDKEEEEVLIQSEVEEDI